MFIQACLVETLKKRLMIKLTWQEVQVKISLAGSLVIISFKKQGFKEKYAFKGQNGPKLHLISKKKAYIRLKVYKYAYVNNTAINLYPWDTGAGVSVSSEFCPMNRILSIAQNGLILDRN